MVSEATCIFQGVVTFLLIEYLWELYLSIRQHKVYQQANKVPEELNEIINEETYNKARVYGLDKSSFSIIKDLFGTITTVVIILVNGFVHFWNIAGIIISTLGYDADNEILRSAAFMLTLNIFNTITTLPFSIYHTFVLEERHGFNKQTVGFFIKDKIKTFIVGQVIMLPVISAVIYIVKIGGDYFFIYLWIFAMAVTFILLTVYPNCIAPLFDKYTPLPEGELRTSIEELAASIDFPLYKLYVVEGSKRSTHSNAYFYGFFKNKRIVLFDTLLKDYVPDNATTSDIKDVATYEKKGCNNPEVLAVLAHELGHWKLNHVLKNIVIMQMNLLLIFLVFGLLFQYEAMYRAFGFQHEKPILIGLVVVLQFIFSPYNAILNFLMTILSRRFEFQADAFAKQLGRSKYLREALIKLNKDNLGFPVYDWMYSMWHHSHPPLLERLKALDKTD
ncbi:CAAX prenyl protease 1-like protein [Cryptotermes secundus]|uniref:CAAX prenyl protease n=1 Tax=Cryptotermes secundus TaxID=105785 RepID=A0A2J7RBX4_9NEOP|nr:CAAX prenyl protease 1 homolog [Cryptotermes secundus]PNF38343.1 CAAX prenyl protease 1-like protein [Cryptotermes secundus]